MAAEPAGKRSVQTAALSMTEAASVNVGIAHAGVANVKK
jgi:hypothetical protein